MCTAIFYVTKRKSFPRPCFTVERARGQAGERMMDSHDSADTQKVIQKRTADRSGAEVGMRSSGMKKASAVSRPEDLQYDYSSETYQSGMSERIDVSMSRERRTYPRRPCFLSVNYATEERAYQEFIQDISASGAFIETRHALPVGQNIAMTFALPGKRGECPAERKCDQKYRQWNRGCLCPAEPGSEKRVELPYR